MYRVMFLEFSEMYHRQEVRGVFTRRGKQRTCFVCHIGIEGMG